MQIPKIKISVRVIAVLIGILGVLFYFWSTGTKAPEIESKTHKLNVSNQSDAVIEKNLAMLNADKQFYLDETDRLFDETEQILTEFPTFMYLEDKILYADTLLKTDLNGYNLAEFSYGQSNYIMNVYYGVDDEEQNNMLELYSVSLSGKYTDLTYKQIKEILDYGLTSTQRFVVSNMTMGYNEESGYITGEFSFTTYFIPGQSTPYEFPESVVDGLGESDRIDNLFGARLEPTIKKTEN
jgi:hypothetical protein